MASDVLGPIDKLHMEAGPADWAMKDKEPSVPLGRFLWRIHDLYPQLAAVVEAAEKVEQWKRPGYGTLFHAAVEEMSDALSALRAKVRELTEGSHG